MILADTSVWIDYLRAGNLEMHRRLKNGQIAMHPFIVAEIALGSLHHRQKRLGEMDALNQVQIANLREVRVMIELRQLFSKGLGLVDAHLLLSCLLTPGLHLWTLDIRMETAARSIGITIHSPANP